eukprot:scpid53797/ scgid20282/ 
MSAAICSEKDGDGQACVGCKKLRETHGAATYLLCCFHSLCEHCYGERLEVLTPSDHSAPCASGGLRCPECFSWTNLSDCIRSLDQQHDIVKSSVGRRTLGLGVACTGHTRGCSGAESDLATRRLCDWCAEDIADRQAVAACVECCAALCSDHFIAHNKSRTTNCHTTLAPIQQQQQQQHEEPRRPCYPDCQHQTTSFAFETSSTSRRARRDSGVFTLDELDHAHDSNHMPDSMTSQEGSEAHIVCDDIMKQWVDQFCSALDEQLYAKQNDVTAMEMCMADIRQTATKASQDVGDMFEKLRQNLAARENAFYDTIDELRWELQCGIEQQKLHLEQHISYLQRVRRQLKTATNRKARESLHAFCTRSTTDMLNTIPYLSSTCELPAPSVYSWRFEWTEFESVRDAVQRCGTLLSGCCVSPCRVEYVWNVRSHDIEWHVQLDKVAKATHTPWQIAVMCPPAPTLHSTHLFDCVPSVTLTTSSAQGKSVVCIAATATDMYLKQPPPGHWCELRPCRRDSGVYKLYRVPAAKYPLLFRPADCYNGCMATHDGRALAGTTQRGRHRNDTSMMSYAVVGSTEAYDKPCCEWCVMISSNDCKLLSVGVTDLKTLHRTRPQNEYPAADTHSVFVSNHDSILNNADDTDGGNEDEDASCLRAGNGLFCQSAQDVKVFDGNADVVSRRCVQFGSVLHFRMSVDCFTRIRKVSVRVSHISNLASTWWEATYVLPMNAVFPFFGFVASRCNAEIHGKPVFMLLPVQ